MGCDVLSYKIRKLGFCCPNSYFRAVAAIPTGIIAVELSVHKRTARRWRADFRAGKFSCLKAPRCFLLPSSVPSTADPSSGNAVEIDLALPSVSAPDVPARTDEVLSPSREGVDRESPH